MKFSIDRKYFFDKLSTVARAISVFSPLPALSGICIVVSEDQITLTGSDANISIQTVITKGELNQLHIESTGSIIVESKYLLEIVRKIDSSMIDFELIDYHLVRIASRNGQFNLNGIQASEYPDVDFSQPSNKIIFKSKDLKEIVAQTAFACGEDEQRPTLNGVNFQVNQNKLYCTGTDSYRMAHKVLDIQSQEDFQITIPKKSLMDLIHSISEDVEDIEFYADSKKAQFIFDKTIFQTRLLEGSYPNIQRIIPTSFVASLEVSSRELANVIDRTNFIRNDKIHLIRMECSEEMTRIKTSSMEIGNSDEVLTDCIYKGDPLMMTYNGTYILDAIKALGSEKVCLEFSSQDGPVRIYNPENLDTIMIAVPIRSY